MWKRFRHAVNVKVDVASSAAGRSALRGLCYGDVSARPSLRTCSGRQVQVKVRISAK